MKHLFLFIAGALCEVAGKALLVFNESGRSPFLLSFTLTNPTSHALNDQKSGLK